MVDFRASTVSIWDSKRGSQLNPQRPRYEMAYSDVRISPLPTDATVQAPTPTDAPGPKPGRSSGKALCAQIADEILAGPEAPARGRGFKAKLAEAVRERLHTQGENYKLSSIERHLRELTNPIGKYVTL